MSYVDDLAVIINHLVDSKVAKLKDANKGKPKPGGMGSSLGSATVDLASTLDGADDDDSGSGGDEDKRKGNDEWEVGDRPEDMLLKDCETGEPVTLDGFQENNTKPPAGFENCEAKKKPSMAELEGKTIFVARLGSIYYDPDLPKTTYSLNSDAFYSYVSEGIAFAQSESNGGCVPSIGAVSDNGSSGSWMGRPYGIFRPGSGEPYCGGLAKDRRASYRTSTSAVDKQAYIDNFVTPTWNVNDKNHLVWNQQKGCFERLCGELNTQISSKYEGCKDEMILCNADGDKIKVTVEGDTTTMTYEKTGTQVQIKGGKVINSKKLTETQVARAFR